VIDVKLLARSNHCITKRLTKNLAKFFEIPIVQLVFFRHPQYL